MSAVNCPKCGKPLPDSVIKGPARAVVRCGACSAELLWLEGKALAKSSTTTRPTQTPKANPASSKTQTMTPAKATASPVVAPKKAEAKPALGEDEPTQVEAPKPASMAKPTIQGMPAAAPPKQPTKPTQPLSSSVKKAPIITVGANKEEPRKVEPRIGSFPLPGGGQSRPGVISKVQADVPVAPGPTVDPMGWFDEKGTSRGEPAARKAEPAALPPAPAEAPPPKAFEIEKPVLPPRSDSVVDGLPVAQPKSMARPNMAGADIPGAEMATDVLDSEELVEMPASRPPATAAKPAPEPKVEVKVVPPPEPRPTPRTDSGVAGFGMAAPAPALQPSPQLAPTQGGDDDFLTAAGGMSRRKLAIAGAGLLIVACVGVVLLSRGGKAQPPANPPPVAEVKPVPAPSGAPSFGPVPAEKPAEAPPPKPAPVPVAAAGTSRKHGHDGDPPAETPRAATPRSSRKVVLEYDPKPNQKQTPEMGPMPAGADAHLLEKARDTYHRGNWSLFVGNNFAALDAYHETLKIYPGYIAGYRGLGLAYEELGKKKEALEALKTYVKTVPSAHDVPLIKRRIERLERSLDDQKE